ncbi:tyrosine-type recombinase/integrase [Novosphingobium mangrovi (ex Hu et al. 2023)]|uniref:Tyrosine-type recombinase/integrase n=1 Tax=Novosphingobium mangrovi (ex Hu et al. 2023) TaxID=2930094 RepID=A0ABT0AGF5_9SPHN|nr:site-specific integrase [Novosphingobium mangrovi (ex Hu et al. 2023)]MCJ1962281.1 tyrosine-type recombinase/integrase [Novosphingobium mangrovi (ex Hu et al. 2023)]
MALTEVAIRKAKAGPKPYKMGDSSGLFLLVQPSGGKLWRMKYRVDGREKKLGLGTYPEVGLAEARRRRDAAREQMAQGKDPSREKQREKARERLDAENTFAALASEFCEKRRHDGSRAWAPATAKRCEYLLSVLNSSIGNLPIADIEPADILTAIRRIESKGKLESAKRTLQLAGSVFRYAVATARLKSDPTRDLRGALMNPTVTHYGAILDPAGAGELLRAIDGYEGQPITKLAMQLAPHVFVRPGELRHAEWSEFDFDGALWTIPASKTKMRKDHLVPLSRQAIKILQEAQLLTGPSDYVFPSVRTRRRPMSDNTINAGLRRLGYTTDEMTAHGFRAMASTLLNESGKWNPDAIERALAHGDSDKVRAAYHRGAHWKERVKMAQWWSDYLDKLRAGAEVAPVKTAKR